MRSALRVAHNVRLAAILAFGAFALHQLRYLAVSSAELTQPTHGYVTDLLPLLGVLILAAALATLVRATESASPERAPLGRRIAVFATALLAIYIGQESIEGLTTGGHPFGAADTIADGDWLAVPLALALGALAAVLARALEAVEHAIAVVHAERPLQPRPSRIRGHAVAARALRLASSPLAFGLARRPPPPAPA